MVKKLFVFLLLISPLQLLAQTILKGSVYEFDNKTSALPQVAVRNLSNKQVAVTRAGGEFEIPAKAGDLITFTLMGYHVDTLFLTDLKPKRIYLPQDSRNLKEVAIVSTKVSPYLDLSNPTNAAPSTRVSTDGLAGKSNNDRAGGLRLALGYGKYKREAAKLKMLEERDQFETEINTYYNEKTITNLVKLRGTDLQEFMNMYRPTVALVKGERPFNYDYYIAQAYQKWLKLSPEQKRVPPMQRLKRN